MTDVRLVQGNDDGDFYIEGGIVELSGGLESAAYLSLFGGDEQDNGAQDSAFEWWGNSLETDEAFKLRSRTQNLLRSLPNIPASLRKVEDAARLDLKWFIDKNVASSLDVEASFDGPTRIRLTIKIEADGNSESFEFIENWRAEL